MTALPDLSDIFVVNNRAEVLEGIRAKKSQLENFGVVRIGIFGSAARDELTQDSDVDVLVEFAPGKVTLTNFMGAKFMLEEEFGRKVDLATARSLNKPILWESVSQDLLYVS